MLTLRSMRLATLAIAIAIVVAGAAPAAAGVRWDWTTMGDHKRTIHLAGSDGSAVLLVGPCQYRALRLSNAIDVSRTPTMLGDARARRGIRCTGGPHGGGPPRRSDPRDR